MSGTIDLSQLPAPDVVEAIDYEEILAERKAKLVSLYPADQQADVAATLELESEPMVKMLQENAYREVVLRQRINDSSRAVMLTYAKGKDLDQIGANFDVERLVITPEDTTTTPPTAAVMESDEDYLERIQMSFDGYSVAGPRGAYVFAARSASGQVKSASATSPQPGHIAVFVLSRTGDGTASDELLATVKAALSEETTRPMSDNVEVLSASVIPYTIEAVVEMYKGPDPELVLSAAKTKAQAYADTMHKNGYDIAQSAIFGALHQPGAKRVILAQPTADIVTSEGQAAYCTGITLTPKVVDDE